jgi:hypothetical protein
MAAPGRVPLPLCGYREAVEKGAAQMHQIETFVLGGLCAVLASVIITLALR